MNKTLHFISLLSALVANPAAAYVFQTLDVPGATRTEAVGINASTQVVGNYVDSAGRKHGFLYNGAAFATIDYPTTCAVIINPVTDNLVGGINDSGQIAGVFYGGNYVGMAPCGIFIYNPDGTYTLAPNPTPPMGSRGPFDQSVSSINAIGEVVGSASYGPSPSYLYTVSYGLLYNGADSTSLIDQPRSTLASINVNGEAVGYYDLSFYSNIRHGFLYAGGSIIPIDVDAPNSFATTPSGITDSSQVAGSYKTCSGTLYPNQGCGGPSVSHGFLYNNGQLVTVDFPGAVNTYVRAINASGDLIGDYDDGQAQYGFVYRGGTFTLVKPDGATRVSSASINARGDITGSFNDAAGTHGFIGYATPSSKEECMNGGWKLFGFKNQGQCIQYVNTGK